MVIQPIARILRSSTHKFFESLGWSVHEKDHQTLICTKIVAGNEVSWCLHFEDENSTAQLPPPKDYAQALLQKASEHDRFDLLATDRALTTKRWSDDIQPLLEQRFAARRNWHIGTLTSLLNRFAEQIAKNQASALRRHYDRHGISTPTPTYFKEGGQAFEACAKWLTGPQGRILLITGDPGAGKSVFSLSLSQHVGTQFLRSPQSFPAPFLIWFSSTRPANLDDLITITLQELGLTDLTSSAVKFLLSQGRVVFILDGFDEISRALADQAEATIDALSSQINRKTLGRLFLTSRPAFLEHENHFSMLSRACEDEQAPILTIAPYADEQQHTWVMDCSLDGTSRDERSRHWQRIQSAFARHPSLRELCRTPVYLRMLSDVIRHDRSVSSRDELITTFCAGMWERERGRRRLKLSDKHYAIAYEAISAIIVDERSIKPADVGAFLQLYLETHAKDLLDDFPSDTDALYRDLAIGPLTSVDEEFAFTHQILTGYFYARYLVRSLIHIGPDTFDRWNREIFHQAWDFLPSAVRSAELAVRDDIALLETLRRQTRSGLILANLVRAFGCEPPSDLFQEKDIVDLAFGEEGHDRHKLPRRATFAKSNIRSAIFDSCDLAAVDFRGARIGRLTFINCKPGAQFDSAPKLADDAEITIVRSKGAKNIQETYVGDDISRAFRILSASEVRTSKPEHMGQAAAAVIVASLFKVDKHSRDYPERRKIQNRLTAWLTQFNLDDSRLSKHIQVCMEMFEALVDSDLVVKNPARERTFVPAPKVDRQLQEFIRTGVIPPYSTHLREIASTYDAKLRDL